MPEMGLSVCCGAPLKVASGDEGTSFYVCSNCDKPADPPGPRDDHLLDLPPGESGPPGESPASRMPAFDEHDAFLCACKGLPYTVAEWEAEVVRLEKSVADAQRRWRIAVERGVCLPARFDYD